MIKCEVIEYALVHEDKMQKMTKSKDMWEWCIPVSWLHQLEPDWYVGLDDLHKTLVVC